MVLRKTIGIVAAIIGGISLLFVFSPLGAQARNDRPGRPSENFDEQIINNGNQLLKDGKNIFRFDTFGDEAFWGDTLRLHEAIAGERFGGVGKGVSPNTALSLGLKVDAEALPPRFVQRVKNGKVDLYDPAATLDLLKFNSIVGLTGFFDKSGKITSIGIQCALCHSTVDDSLAPGIGNRLDGWANRDLDVGAIIAIAPDLSAFAALLGIDEEAVRTVLNSWGPGKFDAELSLDGKAFNDEKSGASLIPPAFGLAGVNMHGWIGWGSVTYWNALVANLEMHGSGTFYDPRLNHTEKFPIAAAAGFANVRNTPDLITSKLAPLHAYQLAIPAPQPPQGSFNKEAAQRGKDIFNGKARCAQCHVPPLFTEPGWNLHTPDEIGIDYFQASRGPETRYRTAPLKGLWSHQKGGFYHDGRYSTLDEVIGHYDEFFDLELDNNEKSDLIEYLMSI